MCGSYSCPVLQHRKVVKNLRRELDRMGVFGILLVTENPAQLNVAKINLTVLKNQGAGNAKGAI